MNKNKSIRICGRVVEQGNTPKGYKYAEINVPLIEFTKQMKDLPEEYKKIINEHFWELI